MHLFKTKIGTCGISWNERGIERVVMRPRPRKTGDAAVKPPAYVREAACRIANHLAGKTDDLRDIDIDLSSCTPFTKKVYAALRKVPAGKVVTYGGLAAKAGSPHAARAVGRAMATNPLPLIIPCHRVIGSDGSLCGFTSPGGLRLKAQLLSLEGSAIR